MNKNKSKLYESAFIKSIRRCLVDDAIYWGTALVKLGKADVVWRRMFIHLSEDIGVADKTLPANIAALYQNYQILSVPGATSFESPGAERLPLVHAIMLMALAQKSRAVDNATIVHFCGEEEERKIPDYCIDYHSPLGRRMGRDVHHFFTEAGKIENESKFNDRWKTKACKILTSQKDKNEV